MDNGILIIIISILAIGGMGYLVYQEVFSTPSRFLVFEEIGLLEQVLSKELVKIEGGNCLNYSIYYNKTLSEKYPELDIRWPRNVDLCNNLTICKNYHTFIVVAGYGSECILDQKNIVCIDLLKTNLSKEEVDKLTW